MSPIKLSLYASALSKSDALFCAIVLPAFHMLEL
jgi:hypothetical protein